MNKSVTDQPLRIIVAAISCLIIASFVGCGAATSPSPTTVAATPRPNIDIAAPLIVTAPQPTPTTNHATTIALVKTPQPAEPTQVQPITTTIAAAGTNSPLSTISMTATVPTDVALAAALSETVDLQERMTISMAIMARSLIQIMQQPVASAPLLPDPAQSNQTTDESSAMDNPVDQRLMLTDTVAPPLPNLQIGGIALPPNNQSGLEANGAVPVLVTQPLLQPDGAIRTAHVPILMYHYLSSPPADADIYRRDLSVSPARFAEHLDRIVADGYTVIHLYDLVAYLMQGTALPPNPVVITFDDGYRDNYENALPLLRERDMTATFFVVMEFINQERPEYLTWSMVDEMAASGMDFEVHGVDHTTLRGRSQADLEFQALRSHETLQNRLNSRPRFLSYPAGEYDQQTITTFQSAGYWAGLTTIQGATHYSNDLFELRRVRIRGTTTADELSRLLALDW